MQEWQLRNYFNWNHVSHSDLQLQALRLTLLCFLTVLLNSATMARPLPIPIILSYILAFIYRGCTIMYLYCKLWAFHLLLQFAGTIHLLRYSINNSLRSQVTWLEETLRSSSQHCNIVCTPRDSTLTVYRLPTPCSVPPHPTPVSQLSRMTVSVKWYYIVTIMYILYTALRGSSTQYESIDHAKQYLRTNASCSAVVLRYRYQVILC